MFSVLLSSDNSPLIQDHDDNHFYIIDTDGQGGLECSSRSSNYQVEELGIKHTAVKEGKTRQLLCMFLKIRQTGQSLSSHQSMNTADQASTTVNLTDSDFNALSSWLYLPTFKDSCPFSANAGCIFSWFCHFRRLQDDFLIEFPEALTSSSSSISIPLSISHFFSWILVVISV